VQKLALAAQAQTAEQRARVAEQEKEEMRQRLLAQLNQVQKRGLDGMDITKKANLRHSFQIGWNSTGKILHLFLLAS
jgi:hypothetical protein